MNARADLIEGLAHGAADRLEVTLDGLPRVHHAKRLRLNHGAREQVPHVVVNLAGDAGALRERCQANLVVLRIEELAVPRLERELALA